MKHLRPYKDLITNKNIRRYKRRQKRYNDEHPDTAVSYAGTEASPGNRNGAPIKQIVNAGKTNPKEKKVFEGIRDLMIPKSEEEVIKSFNNNHNKKTAQKKLHTACAYGQLWMVKRIVEQEISGVDKEGNPIFGCDPSEQYNTAIMTAHLYKFYDIVEYLLNNEKVRKSLPDRKIKRFEKEIEDYKKQSTNESVKDLMTPKSEEHVNAHIEKFIKSEKNKHDYLDDASNKLVSGVKAGVLSVVKEAIAEGADINNTFHVCLTIAVINGEYEIAKCLLDNGAKIDMRIADESKKRPEMLDLLKEYPRSKKWLR